MAGENERAEISRITLPNNNTYYFKDEVARNLITSNGTFRIAWNGSSAPTVTAIPAGVVVTYNSTSYTGSLTASVETLKDFYLVHSSTEIGNDIYDEYVTVQGGTTASPTYSWEKIGDTQIQLSQVVTGVTLNQATTDFVTGYTNQATASVIKGNASFTVTDPTITVTPTTTYLQASASGGTVTYNSKVTATVITGYEPTSDTFVTGITTTKNQKLVQTTITGVSGAVTASKVSQSTAQTTVSGFSTNSTTNAFFKGWSVTDENLTIGGVESTTQSTSQVTIDVASVTVPKAATSATTVATGALDANGGGAAVVTDVTSAATSALTALGDSSTASVLGATTTLKLGSNQTISLTSVATSGDGKVQVATGITSAAATGGSVALAANSTTTVLTSIGTATTAAALNTSTTITVTKAL